MIRTNTPTVNHGAHARGSVITIFTATFASVIVSVLILSLASWSFLELSTASPSESTSTVVLVGPTLAVVAAVASAVYLNREQPTWPGCHGDDRRLCASGVVACSFIFMAVYIGGIVGTVFGSALPNIVAALTPASALLLEAIGTSLHQYGHTPLAGREHSCAHDRRQTVWTTPDAQVIEKKICLIAIHYLNTLNGWDFQIFDFSSDLQRQPSPHAAPSFCLWNTEQSTDD
jgi:hypothetical protein